MNRNTHIEIFFSKIKVMINLEIFMHILSIF